MDALEQADGHRVGDGVIEFAVNHRLHQRGGAALFVHAPGKIRVFLRFQYLQVVDRHVTRGDGELLGGHAARLRGRVLPTR